MAQLAVVQNQARAAATAERAAEAAKFRVDAEAKDLAKEQAAARRAKAKDAARAKADAGSLQAWTLAVRSLWQCCARSQRRSRAWSNAALISVDAQCRHSRRSLQTSDTRVL